VVEGLPVANGGDAREWWVWGIAMAFSRVATGDHLRR
jgi:hypothetical protein